jgi:hypothetical protein
MIAISRWPGARLRRGLSIPSWQDACRRQVGGRDQVDELAPVGERAARRPAARQLHRLDASS